MLRSKTLLFHYNDSQYIPEYIDFSSFSTAQITLLLRYLDHNLSDFSDIRQNISLLEIVNYVGLLYDDDLFDLIFKNTEYIWYKHQTKSTYKNSGYVLNSLLDLQIYLTKLAKY